MKLFVIAALIAFSNAGRLEHLQQQQMLRAYLPPFQMSFGANPAAHGISSGPSHPGFNAIASFPSASNQYLPPDHGPSAGSSHDAVSIDSAHANSAPSHQFGHQFAPSQQFGHQASPAYFGHQAATPQGAHSFGSQAQFQPQSAATRQYLAPHHSSQDIPQQSFDEQTGYQY